MDFKQISYNLKDLDDNKGVIVAYANAYNNEDSDKDISAVGSFDKTVSENFKRIRVLKDHNPTMMIGVPLDINTKDSFGLLTTTQFNMNKPLGKDMFTDVKLMHDNGLNAELSIGYNVIKRDVKNKSIITEYKLMEYSFLSSWAANELATVQNIKGVNTHYGILSLIEKAYDMDYSDERLREIESILKGKSKDSYDKEFISKMIPHHQMALDMVKEFDNEVKNPELKKIMQNILVSQSSEIKKMQQINNTLKSLSNQPLLDNTLIDKPIIIDTLKSFSQSLNLK